MMSSERMGCVALNDFPPLSPELQLGTMNTCDMFDSGWDCLSEGSNSLSGTENSSSPLGLQTNLAEEDLCAWDNDHVLQVNLPQTNLELSPEGSMGLLTFAEELLEDEAQSSLHDARNNFSDASSSSSTITSHSVPQSHEPLFINTEISVLDAVPTSLFSSFSHNLDGSSLLTCAIPDDVLSEESRKNFEGQSSQEHHKSNKKPKMKPSTKEFNRKKGSHKEKQKSHRLPLTAASQPSYRSNMLSNLLDPSSSDCQTSPCQKYKASAKENGFSSRKKKIHKILDSNMKWSELGSSEQFAIGEGLGAILSQSLGIRETLDLHRLLNIISPESPFVSSGDIDWTSILDNEKFESVSLYLRGHGNEDRNCRNRLIKTKYGKSLQKHRSNKSMRKRGSYHYLKEHQTMPVQKGEKKYNTQPTKINNISPTRPHKQANYSLYLNKCKKKSSSEKCHQSVKIKKSTSHDLLQMRTRTRKEFRQMMKEKKSGLFEQEMVVSLSTSANCASVQQQDEDDEDIDILN